MPLMMVHFGGAKQGCILDQQGHARIAHDGYDASAHLETVVSKAMDSLLTSPRNKQRIGKELAAL